MLAANMVASTYLRDDAEVQEKNYSSWVSIC